MAKAKEKDMEGSEDVNSILGKIKNVVSGKEKVVIEDDKPESSAADDDAMELTEVVEVVEVADNQSLNAQTATTEAQTTQAEEEEKFVDILKEIDTALEKQYAEGEAAQAEQAAPVEVAQIPEQVAVEAPINANVAQAATENAVEQPVEVKKEFAEDNSQNIIENQVVTNMAENKPNILSEDIANKSSKAIQNLLNNIPRPDVDSPAFRSAVTLEDIAMEMIRPMLKEWLDKNLEVIVRDIVEKEIKKIIPRD